MTGYVDTGDKNVGDKLMCIRKITSTFFVKQNHSKDVDQKIIKNFLKYKMVPKKFSCMKNSSIVVF